MILTNVSYFICFAKDREYVSLLSDAFHRRVRILEISTEKELIRALGSVKYLVGIVIDFNLALDAESLKKTLSQKTVNIFSIGKGPEGIEEFEEHLTESIIEKCLWRLIPNGLADLSAFACERSGYSLFPNMEWVFHPVGHAIPETFTHFGVCDSIATPFLGRLQLFFDHRRLTKILGPPFDQDETLLIDHMQEFANQYLGVVSQHLEKVGYDSRVFIPQIYKGSIELEETGPVIPMVSVANANESILMRIGYLNAFNSEKMDLEKIELLTEEGEIDFL